MSDTSGPPIRFGKIKENEGQPKARQPPKKEKQRSRRGRFFSLVTYATTSDIEKVFSIHEEQVRYWTYIVHDKDVNDDGTLKELHTHILADLYNANTDTAIKKWFAWCKDSKGEKCNTLVEIGEDRQYLCDYLTHANDKEKYQYQETDIQRYGDMLLIAGVKPRNDEEKALNIIDDMLQGSTYYELTRHYGREFIINCSRYEDMISRMIYEGSLPNYLTIEQKNQIYFKYRKDF